MLQITNDIVWDVAMILIGGVSRVMTPLCDECPKNRDHNVKQFLYLITPSEVLDIFLFLWMNLFVQFPEF